MLPARVTQTTPFAAAVRWAYTMPHPVSAFPGNSPLTLDPAPRSSVGAMKSRLMHHVQIATIGMRLVMGACLLFLPATRLQAEGHGPAFTLAPPTLGQGQWSSDTVGMTLGTHEGTAFMFRETIGYGISEDLQAMLSFPLGPTLDKLTAPPRTRVGAMMGAFGDVESSLLWRFHRQAPAVGSRFESTLQLSGSAPTEDRRGGVLVGPAFHAAAVTGYASRSVYGWAGVGYQRYFERGDDRLGDLPYGSAVFGWRPRYFRQDYPAPDWRLFIEGLAEFPRRDRLNGVSRRDSSGSKLLLGPSVLGLYGNWGVEAGFLFPVAQDLNGRQIEERFRAKIVFTLWF
jgi:hypothetical protein